MKQTSLPLVDALGTFQKEYREPQLWSLGRTLFFVALGLFTVLIILTKTSFVSYMLFWAGSKTRFIVLDGLIFFRVKSSPILYISSIIIFIGLLVYFARSLNAGLFILSPTIVAIYTEGFVFRTFISKPQKVRWEQVVETRVASYKGPVIITEIVGQTRHRRYEYQDIVTNYILKLDSGQQISLISLNDGKALFNEVISIIRKQKIP